MKTDYEVTYILRPQLEEAEVDERANAIADLIKRSGGEVVTLDKLGKKRLAYEIADFREGVYVVMAFKSEPAVARELERQLRLNDDVVRELVVKIDPRAAAAAPPPPPQPTPAPA
ncbi:MAG: 30S ribosomal protein S6 [Candidatus Eremiobacteraeota bacterium]|nr:30S ribosomal protein S6 [Candidatus Eremiobacteraeota bacterium]MBV9403367.1 30S ribosomal protein S6 [Candidatus Eremiobacteraeota bacterium]MBV9972310.1 30S ribosomal protein S6 [Candidatus Eremiobacteraeota bacterium]